MQSLPTLEIDPPEIPESVASESCLIASMMLDAGCIPEVRGIVASADAFFQTDHKILYRVLCDLADRGSKIDAVIVREELIRRKQFDQIGGFERLGEILGSVPSPDHATHYADIVADKAKQRSIITLCTETIRECTVPHIGERGSVVLERLLRKAADLQAGGKAGDIQSIGEILEAVWQEMRGGSGVRLLATGIDPLDAMIGGLGFGEMAIIAARPSMGKSLIAKQLARNVARRGIPVGIVSVEETGEKIARNHIAAEALIENHAVRRGSFTAEQWKSVECIVHADAALPIYINDQASRLSDVCSTISVMASRYKCQLIVVDYLQLINAQGGQSREQQVSIISRRLKTLIKELGVAGVVVAQLNRGNEAGGAVRPPRMSDLRDSGQIEQDADLILLLHRPDYYNRDESDAVLDHKCYIIPAKNRDGNREEDVVLIADLPHQRFITEAEAGIDDHPF